jgi:hypothetical protein
MSNPFEEDNNPFDEDKTPSSKVGSLPENKENVVPQKKEDTIPLIPDTPTMSQHTEAVSPIGGGGEKSIAVNSSNSNNNIEMVDIKMEPIKLPTAAVAPATTSTTSTSTINEDGLEIAIVGVLPNESSQKKTKEVVNYGQYLFKEATTTSKTSGGNEEKKTRAHKRFVHAARMKFKVLLTVWMTQDDLNSGEKPPLHQLFIKNPCKLERASLRTTEKSPTVPANTEFVYSLTFNAARGKEVMQFWTDSEQLANEWVETTKDMTEIVNMNYENRERTCNVL